MRVGIMLETNEPEKAWNCGRFAHAALQQGASPKKKLPLNKRQFLLPQTWLPSSTGGVVPSISATA
jgi:hypothetical protein